MVRFNFPWEYATVNVEMRHSGILNWDKDKFNKFKLLRKEYNCGCLSTEATDEYFNMIDEIYNTGFDYLEDNFEVEDCGELDIDGDGMEFIDDDKPLPKSLTL